MYRLQIYKIYGGSPRISVGFGGYRVPDIFIHIYIYIYIHAYIHTIDMDMDVRDVN